MELLDVAGQGALGVVHVFGDELLVGVFCGGDEFTQGWDVLDAKSFRYFIAGRSGPGATTGGPRPGRQPTALPAGSAPLFDGYHAELSGPGGPLDADTVGVYACRVRQYLAWLSVAEINGDPLDDPASGAGRSATTGPTCSPSPAANRPPDRGPLGRADQLGGHQYREQVQGVIDGGLKCAGMASSVAARRVPGGRRNSAAFAAGPCRANASTRPDGISPTSTAPTPGR